MENRVSLWDHILFFERYPVGTRTCYANCFLSIPDALLSQTWDAILLDVTLCGKRWANGSMFDRAAHVFAGLGGILAPKIAFPQDDYTRPAVLDDWLVSAKVDIVYSVLSGPFDVLYPRYSKYGKIKTGFTGYVDDKDIGIETPLLQKRPIDIGYRARRLPAHYGKIGQAKWMAAERFKAEASSRGFVCDISTDRADTIFGPAWREFILNSKFTFGTNSGSSVIDKRGEIAEKEKAILASNPEATFEEIEKIAFPGLDGLYEMTALSPRNIEAALLRSCQILVKGEYGGILAPWQDYIPLEPDFSNLEAVFAAMRDLDRCQAMADQCYDTIVNNAALRYSHHAAEVKQDILNILADRCGGKIGESRIGRVKLETAILLNNVSSQLLLRLIFFRGLFRRIKHRAILWAKKIFGERIVAAIREAKVK